MHVHDPASTGRIRGSSVGEFAAWYLREVDEERMRAAARKLAPELRALIDVDHPRLGLLPSRWYPAGVVHGVLDGILEGVSQADAEALVLRAAEATVEGLRRGVYKILFSWFLTPERYGWLVQTAWERNYDTGRVEATILGERRHRGLVHDWASHHPFLCKLNVAVKAEIYRAMRCKDVRITERYCVCEGDRACGSILEWSE